MSKTFTLTSSTIWRKPPYAQWITFILVGGGAAGVDGGSGVGGAGGHAGEVVEVSLPASEVPESLTATIGAGGVSANASGGYTRLVNSATGATLIAADGGDGIGSFSAPGVFYPSSISALGGNGGVTGISAGVGATGQSTRYAVASAGGTAGNRAAATPGYGSGGSGGCQASGGTAGGGSGGAGYGTTVLAGGGGALSAGANGAPGVIIIRVS